MPGAFEVFLERVAFALHNISHFYDDCEFDFKLFNANMKKAMQNALRKRKAARDRKAAPEAKADKKDASTSETADPLPPAPLQHDLKADEVAADLCEFLRWPKMDNAAFLSRARTVFGYKKDPGLQFELEALSDNTKRGCIEAAMTNLAAIRDMKP